MLSGRASTSSPKAIPLNKPQIRISYRPKGVGLRTGTVGVRIPGHEHHSVAGEARVLFILATAAVVDEV